jgi:predicted nucleotidyltransferase
MTEFEQLLRVLSEAQVKFIVVGGVAAAVHGATRLTRDLDLVYQRTPENLARLVQALAPFAPYLRGAPPGLPFTWDVATLAAGLNFTLTTTIGAVDLFGEIPGGGNYEQLLPHAHEVELFGHRCLVLGPQALVRVKRAAGRPKDLETAAELEAILEETGQGSEGGN